MLPQIFFVDTGASISVVSPLLFSLMEPPPKLNRKDLKPVLTANGNRLKVFGTAKFKMKTTDKIVEHSFYVSSNGLSDFS